MTKTALAGVNFELPASDCIPSEFMDYIHAEWIDRIPRRISAVIHDDGMEIHHAYKESLRIVIPWDVEDLGVFFLKTASLRSREKPYDLLMEITRGTVGRLVDQTENWLSSGVPLSRQILLELSEIKMLFRDANFSKGSQRHKKANLAISSSIQLMNRIGDVFSQCILDLRSKDQQPNQALLGGLFESDSNEVQSDFLKTFNSAILPIPVQIPDPSTNPKELAKKNALIRKKHEEIANHLHQRGVSTCTRPIIRFNDLKKREDQTIEEAGNELLKLSHQLFELGGSSCKLCYPISGLGYGDQGSWNDQEQIHLTHELISKMKQARPQVPFIIGLDQPFGEAVLFDPKRKTPLQLADALVRMDTPVSAFCLEINLGYYPNGSWIRDLYAFNDLLDAWAQIDRPLLVQLRVPGGVQSIDLDFGELRIAAGANSQASWVKHLFSLAIAKQNVAGVFYGTLIDHPNDDYFGAGLITTDGERKPAFQEINKIRQAIKQSANES